MRNENKLTIENLAVLQFLKSESRAMLSHLPEMAEAVSFYTCTRCMWIGRRDDFPVLKNLTNINGTGFLTGKDAYSFLLRLMSGLESKNIWETEILGQINKGWDLFYDSNPEKGKLFSKLQQNLTHDFRLISNQITKSRRPYGKEQVAKSLSGMKPGETILLVSDQTRDLKLSSMSDRLIRYIANKPENAPKKITVCHPDEKIARLNLSHLFTMRAKRTLCMEVTTTSAPFAELKALFNDFDRIYIDMPMGEDASVDRRIIDAWVNRPARHDNIITHMRGDPQRGWLSNDDWKSLESRQDVVLPEKIRNEVINATTLNNALISLAQDAFSVCSDLRLEDKRPAKRHLANLKELIPAI